MSEPAAEIPSEAERPECEAKKQTVRDGMAEADAPIRPRFTYRSKITP